MSDNNKRKRVTTNRFTIKHPPPEKKIKTKTQLLRRLDLVNTDDEDDGNQINLENNDSDVECEFDSEEELEIRNIEELQSDEDDFISQDDDYKDLLTGVTNIHQMVVNETIGQGNTNKLERDVMLRRVAHHQQLDDRSEHGDYERTITMDDINNGAERIYNTIVTVNNNSVTNVQNTTNNNIMSNSNNSMNNTTINNNHHHHYHNTPAPAETTIAVQSTQQAEPSTPPVEARSAVTTPIPRKALPPPQHQQHTSLIGPQVEMKLCREYNMICQRMSNSTSEDNWLIKYHQQKVKAKAERSRRWRERNKRYLVDNPVGRINRIKKELLVLIGE